MSGPGRMQEFSSRKHSQRKAQAYNGDMDALPPVSPGAKSLVSSHGTKPAEVLVLGL